MDYTPILEEIREAAFGCLFVGGFVAGILVSFFFAYVVKSRN